MKTDIFGLPIKRNPKIHPEYYDYFDNDEESWQEHNMITTDAVYKFGVMGFIGSCVGQAFHDATVKWDIDVAVSRIGECNLVLKWIDYDYESDIAHKVVERKTIRETCNDLSLNRWYKIGELSESVYNLEDLRKLYCHLDDSGCNLAFFGTEEEYDKEESERKRKELDVAAKKFAATSKTAIGTFDFIRRLEEEIELVRRDQEIFNSGECRMERYADYSYAGSASSFWEDNDFENGRYSGHIENLESIMEWLRGECPLLMAKYEEKKLSGEWDA